MRKHVPTMVIAASLVGLTFLGCGAGGNGDVRKIPGWLFSPSEAARIVWRRVFTNEDAGEPVVRFQSTDSAAPIPHVKIPRHPFMASDRANNMHEDAYMSDTSEAPGPRGSNLEIRSRTQGFGGYGTIAYDGAGRLVGIHTNGRRFKLELMDPYTLEELAAFTLPARPIYWILQGVMPWAYLGGGIYFYLDEQNRVIAPTADNTIQVVALPDPKRANAFQLIRTYDLAAHVVPMHWPKQDSLVAVLPDWDGEFYWWATNQGMIGTVDAKLGTIRTLRLENELIENSFAVGEEGAFILSDHALYRFQRDPQGNPRTVWRTAYDRGSQMKPGLVSRGSGTSVTLAGGTDGLVIVADNAEPRINVLFVRRSNGSVACQVPVFEDGKSGTDVSPVGFEQADENGRVMGKYSAIVENNWGYGLFPVVDPVPGLTRVDATRREDGSYGCEVVWNSEERGTGAFKLSFASGLVYKYYRDDRDPISRWYLSAVDFRTGKTAYRLRAGAGQGFNNGGGTTFLHPGGGLAYSTTLFGLVMLRDVPADAARPPVH